MADEEQPAKNSKPAPAPKKRRLGLIVAVIVAMLAATAGGAVAGPMVQRKLRATAATVKIKRPQEKPNDTVALTANFEAIVIDLYDSEKILHHLKVGMTVELHDGVAPEDFTRYVPRGREAAISYLRGLSFEEATNPKGFTAVRDHLSATVRAAVGSERVVRVVVTDFVAQ